MNPELLRNLWLELNPRRATQLVVVLGLVLLAVSAAPFARSADAAQYIYYAIVVVWGSREAAQCVVDEIRERTWDFQRLSSLTPFEMTWGKLFGATSYIWLGGLICLCVILAADIDAGDPERAWKDIFYYVGIGLLAQSVALFASLIAVRRRQSRTRFNVFLYQAAGVAAGFHVWEAWRMVTATTPRSYGPDIGWWGLLIEKEAFVLGSLWVFVLWAFTGCYRLMRLELQVQNYPVVWLAFTLFMAAYMAGFGSFSFLAPIAPFGSPISLRLTIVNGTFAFLTYAAILFEAKDRVLYRWLQDMLARGRVAAVLSRLQCWMIAYALAMTSGVALAMQLSSGEPSARAVLTSSMVVAGMGFLTRDLGVFLYFGLGPGQKRGDMPAVVTLAILYFVLPFLLRSAGLREPAVLLFPLPGTSWVGATYAWMEAVAMWFLVISQRAKQTAPLAEGASS